MIAAGTKAFWQATLALSLGSFLIFANLYLTQPLLPMLAAQFGVSPLTASYSFTLSTLMLGLSLLLYGPLSDALGRRAIMLATMAGAVLCTLALSQVSSFGALLALRALQGFFLGGLPAIAIAYMGDEMSKPALVSAVGFYISANSLGGISGRLLGGFLGDGLGWPAAFGVVGLGSLLVLAVFAWLLPPSQGFEAKPLHLKRMAGDLLGHLKNKLLLLSYAIGGLNFFIFVNQYSFLTFRLSAEPYALPARYLGLLFLTYLSGTLGSALSGRLAARFSQPLVMALGIALMMVGSLVSLATPLWAIMAGFLVSAFGFFLCHANASSWVSHNARQAKASASSLYLVFYYLGASLGGTYLAPFWHQGAWAGVVLGSLLILGLTFSLCLVLQRSTQPRGELLSS
ncbi:MFS transporter [Gallaecimonas kandeliae]|uniref:MFS transporter n=1 Tax=Gallaecimonas kandeliae TaxID=3029055 RepID=UPI0026486240|nr:MFS transporter [Gallaecimonas kandeliae]WKE65196.1 MFS transporter [Gallaecimonas kandeliae]